VPSEEGVKGVSKQGGLSEGRKGGGSRQVAQKGPQGRQQSRQASSSQLNNNNGKSLQEEEQHRHQQGQLLQQGQVCSESCNDACITTLFVHMSACTYIHACCIHMRSTNTQSACAGTHRHSYTDVRTRTNACTHTYTRRC
jgi:hypothetical protein